MIQYQISGGQRLSGTVSISGAKNAAVAIIPATLLVDGVKVDLVNYPYAWISQALTEDGVSLAGMDDIVAMKLSAAANRGKKKDFIDIATLLDKYSLAEMFARYQTKFDFTCFNLIQLARLLTCLYRC